MFQIVLSLIVGVFIGWNFHLFYISLEPKNIMLSQIYKAKTFDETILPKAVSEENNISTIPQKILNLKLVDKRIILKETEKNSSITDNHTLPNSLNSSYFQALLKENNFSDAMAFYMEGTPKEVKSYQLILKVYFYDKASISPNETIEYLLQYIEIEPQNLDIQLYLAKLYREQSEFEKSINFLFELQNSHQDKNLQRITSDLDTSIERYITKLNESKSISKLIIFLDNIISKSTTPQKYIIRLAELYKSLEIYDKAQELISEIENDSTYTNRAINILREIQERQIESEQYHHKIPLNKSGAHFTINLTINNTPLTLILDTGASYTFVDIDKIPNLEDGREISLNTAGGDIIGELYLTQSLIVQDIELTDFKITVSPFTHQSADGLLGMNFFEKFDLF